MSLPARQASDTSLPADPLAAAQQEMNDERYGVAISLLRAILVRVGRNSAQGRDASALLVEALRVTGDVRGALEENTKLSALLSQSQLDGMPGVSDLREDVVRNAEVLRPEVERADALDRAVATAPAGYLRMIASADRAAFHDDRNGAYSSYARSVLEAMNSGMLRDADIPVLVGAAGKALSLGQRNPEVQRMLAGAEHCALQSDVTLAQRTLAVHVLCRLSPDDGKWKVLNRVAHIIPNTGEAAELHRYAAQGAHEMALRAAKSAVALADTQVNAHDFSHITVTLAPLTAVTAAFPDDPGSLGEQQKRALDIRAMLPLYRMSEETVQEEAAGNCSRVADDYQRLADACVKVQSALPADAGAKVQAERLAVPLARMRREAERSAQLMRLKAAMSESVVSCGFLGLDATIGSDWSHAVGSEGWVLFGMHDKDLAGGPRIMDGSFRYAAKNPDAANAVRRWRDLQGYQSRPMADVPLVDPAAGTREMPISFIDDNGEEYPYAAGPDLEVRLSVPAGSHILSVPLHFSDPWRMDSQYDILLLSGDDANPVCLAGMVVSVPQAPSYLRARITGPAEYTLVVRRTNSLNANIPALFLDADPVVTHAPITDEFSLDELSANGIDVTRTGEGPAVQTVTRVAAGSPSVLQGLVDSLGDGKADTSQWSQLALKASTLSSASDLNAMQRSLAAYLAWRFRERVPLEAGSALAAYAQYAALRYAGSAAMDSLSERAERLRKDGRTAYAEVLDDMLWDRRIAEALADRSPNGSKSLQETALALWSAGPAHYLDMRDVRLTTGAEDTHAGTIGVALDPIYAATKARRLTEAVASGNLRSALNAPSVAGSARRDHIEAAQAWIDLLASKLGVSVNGLAGRGRTASMKAEQPVGWIVYAVACAPLVEGTPIASVVPVSTLVRDPAGFPAPDAAASPGACHLRSDQLETLARAYLGREMFSTDMNAFNAELSARALETLGAVDPTYARAPFVAPLLASLRPVAVGKTP